MVNALYGLCIIAVMSGAMYVYKLRGDLAIAKNSLIVYELNINECKKSIGKQNAAITAVAADINATLVELDKWKAMPPKVRYEVIYKQIPTIEVKSDECKDIKIMLDDIRASGF